MISCEAAVVLFVFNRPDHTKEVLKGLKKNKIKKLYVFGDGARTEEEKKQVEEVRDLIKNIDWCEIEVNFSDSNKGLANSVIQGVSYIFTKGYDSVIVLEDDCVPAENFISFMNQALCYYNNDDEVMHVSGFGLPIKKYTNADSYFTPYPCSWGWGTWSKYWNKCNFDNTEEYKCLLQNKDEIREFNYAGEAFSDFLRLQLEGKVNSWLIRWYFHIFKNEGKCVWVYDSLIKNEGFDGSGVHNNKIDRFNQKHLDTNNIKKDFIFENNKKYNEKLIREFRRHFMGKKYIEKIKTTIYLLTGILIGK